MQTIFVRRDSDPQSSSALQLTANREIVTGEHDFTTAFGSPTSLERDLLLLASSIFAADRGTPRGHREDSGRIFHLSIPVTNAGRIQSICDEIEDVLNLLSNDSWRIELRQVPGAPEQNFTTKRKKGTTLLFSGGLDSFRAALDFGLGENLALVSHVTHATQIRSVQNQLVELLRARNIEAPRHQFFVSSRDGHGFDHDIESSQRTRSFMFLMLAALTARRLGHFKVVMIAENGQMAIHLPLNAARVGAFSTHTAHPDVLASMQRILSNVLGYQLSISNPYIHATKAEVVEGIWKNAREAIPVANSCWRSARLPSDYTHCGACIPCLVRRISIEIHGPDPTSYARNIFVEDFAALRPDDDGRRNLFDLCEFATTFDTQAKTELLDQWPELYSANIDANQTIEMYKRASAEAKTVLGRYPRVASLLQ